MGRNNLRIFRLFIAIYTTFAFSSASSQNSTETCTKDMKIFEQTFLVHLSPQIDSLWPGHDYFLFHRINIYEHIDSTWGRVDSVKIFLPGKYPQEMKNDGQNMDDCPEDSVYGYYELVDRDRIDSYQRYFYSYMIRVYTEKYFLSYFVDAVPFAESLPVPEIITPAQGDTIRDKSMTFWWQPISFADGYGIIVWDHMPMPESFQKGIVWAIFIEDSTATNISLSADSIQLVQGKTYYWALWSWSSVKVIDSSGRWNVPSMQWGFFVYCPDITDIDIPHSRSIPAEFNLSQNYPNPFNLHTSIRYSVPAGMNEQIILKIFNVLGQEICTLVDETKGTGIYTIQWDGKNSQGLSVPSGTYFYELRKGGNNIFKKMMILR